jgi:hypothetical protein
LRNESPESKTGKCPPAPNPCAGRMNIVVEKIITYLLLEDFQRSRE